MARLMRSLLITTAFLLHLVSLASCQSLVHVGDPSEDDSLVDGLVSEDLPQLEKQAVADDFLPTHEWQTVKEGQSIPKGLHVRINLQTGLKEAKLLDDHGQQLDQKALEQALKNIATSHDEPHYNKQSSESGADSSGAGSKQTLRSLDEITAEFASHKITISSEQEILKQLLDYLLKTQSTKEIISLLDDIEYYLHSVDNANYFTDVGGMELLVHMLSNTTDTDLVSSLCLTMGSAAHTNPHVADKLANIGAISVLLKHLELSTSSGAEVAVRRIIFALSAVSCSSSNGMKSFLSGGGLHQFLLVASQVNLPLKVKIKVYTFVADLLGETGCASRLTDSGLSGDDLQMDLVGLCRESSLLLPQVNQPHHLEKLLHFIKVVANNSICSSLSKTLLNSLDTTESALTSLSGDAADPEYTREILDSIISIKTVISDKQQQREEL